MNIKISPCKLVWVSIPLIVTALILWPGLKGPLIYDDFHNLSSLMGEEADYEKSIFDNNAGPFGRGFTMVTFVANHWLSKGLVVFDLKLTNLFIHLLNGLLVFLLIYFLLRIKLPVDKAVVCAALTMSFWLLSPINTGVVFYVIQRAALLATTFMLIACIAYIRLRLSCKKRTIHSLGWVLIFLISWLFALLSKENAVLLPLIILCIEVCFFDKLNINRVNKKIIVVALLIFGMLFSLILVLMNNFGYMDYSNREFSLFERLYTQPIVLFIYLKDMLVPQVIDVRLFRDDFKIRETFWNSATIFSLMFISILMLISLLNLRNSKDKYIGAGILIYFSGHLLESSIFPLELFFLHRNYFPSIGIYLSLVLIINRVVVANSTRKILFVVSVMYCVLLGQHSYAQAKVWSSYDSILLNSYKNNPESVKVNLQIIAELVKKKDLSSSLSINRAIISARPADSLPAKIQRFYIYCELANDIPSQEYRILDKNLNLNHPQMISLALGNFIQSYINRQCDFINIRQIIDSLTSWADTQLSLGKQSASELWTVDFYMIELLLLLEEKEEAIARLNLHISHDNSKAVVFKEIVLNE